MLDTKFKNFSFSIIFFSCVFLVIFFRETCWLVEGSFKASEFAYYRVGRTKDFIENLFFVYPGTGALMFWSNITNSVITLFPYEKAKLFANYFTVFVYFLISSYIFFSKSILLITKKHKIFAVFIVLLSPPMTPEVWMSSAHLRGYFGILSFFLLFHDYENKNYVSNLLSYFLIFFSSICSIYAAALTPAYFLKFYLEKKIEYFYSFLYSFFAFLIQLFIVINYTITNFSSSNRFHFELETFYNYFYNVIVRSFFGSSLPKKLFVNTELYLIPFFNLFVYSSFILVTLFSVIYLIKKKDNISYTMITALIFVSGMIIVGSTEPGQAGGRYAVVPGVILILIIFRFFLIEKNFLIKNFFLALLTFSLIIGSLEYKYMSPFPEALKCIDYSQYKE